MKEVTGLEGIFQEAHEGGIRSGLIRAMKVIAADESLSKFQVRTLMLALTREPEMKEMTAQVLAALPKTEEEK